jgi:hypothetical protein
VPTTSLQELALRRHETGSAVSAPKGNLSIVNIIVNIIIKLNIIIIIRTGFRGCRHNQ